MSNHQHAYCAKHEGGLSERCRSNDTQLPLTRPDFLRVNTQNFPHMPNVCRFILLYLFFELIVHCEAALAED